MSSPRPAGTDPHIKLYVGVTQRARIEHAALILARYRSVGRWLHDQMLTAIERQATMQTGPPRRLNPDGELEPRNQVLRVRLHSDQEKEQARRAQRVAGSGRLSHWLYDWVDVLISELEAAGGVAPPQSGSPPREP